MNKKLLFIPLGVTLGAVAAGLTYYLVTQRMDEECYWDNIKDTKKKKKKKKK